MGLEHCHREITLKQGKLEVLPCFLHRVTLYISIAGLMAHTKWHIQLDYMLVDDHLILTKLSVEQDHTGPICS